MNIIKLIILSSIVVLYSNFVISRGIGETEITTDDGIEVFQNEKYYLLKKNVKITSDDFEISADIIKANFDTDLYDITLLETEGTSNLNAIKYGITGKGDEIDINIKSEEIIVRGKNSYLNLQKTRMNTDGSIKVNNSLQTFELIGDNSNLQNDDLNIYGEYISGSFSELNGEKQINKLNVEDDNLLNINTAQLQMYSQKAIYDDQTNIIELFSKVKIVKGQEIITGDYGYFDTVKNSYKVKSDNTSKVKVTIKKTNE
ncbi:hypothetical protein IDH28_00140 [Pelagibacterales bacterium SAG-MED31]|nr:hypothetical protein [Pelagibacterales bacterium SAG-MED31]